MNKQLKKTEKIDFVKLEDLRLKYLKKSKDNLKKAIKYGSLASAGFIILQCIFGEVYILGILAVLVVGGLMWKSPIWEYEENYKNVVIPIILKSFGDFTYSAFQESKSNGFPTEKTIEKIMSLKKFNIVEDYNAGVFEDCIEGNIDDIKLEFGELKLSMDYGKSSKTVFKGGSFLFTMPFEFESNTVVYAQSNIVKNKSKDDGNFFKTNMLKKLNRVKLEDIAFEKDFEVYSESDQYARYLLSPSIMDKIMEISKWFDENAIGIEFSIEFRGNQILMLAYYLEDMFEVADINKPADEIDYMPKLKEELSLVVSIAKQLKLDYLTKRKLAYKKLYDADLD